MPKLRNEDLSDREFLHAFEDVADEHAGFCWARVLADYLGHFNHDSRAVAMRMSWMKRLGYLDRIDPRQLGLPASEPPRYVLTDAGRGLMSGHISKAVGRALENAGPGDSVLLIRELAQRAYVDGSPVTANATRRQWMHTAAKRG